MEGKSVTIYLHESDHDWIRNHPLYDSASKAARAAIKADKEQYSDESDEPTKAEA